ncbi:LysR family transcriptional regulator [Ancylobacter polymorphus]|uniref:LysR family nitrogen assimilation transcriptional regulator n=1 Tax=Ancylobacter polymorphus TaxID=223390 RepID=A0ABU0BGI6_9HYPH|nr:LysR family transcriptional regulator [Ancylobacter polymorphus]MDQ0304949.1 LysR family nitrogen assimilation transcriptional regulator [Ancylobacter polymorphus]
MAIEYRDIVAFLAVARCESYSRAAGKLHVAQSALSRRVLRLEQRLGIELLERHPRGVRATEAGQILMRRAERLEAELLQVEPELRAFAAVPPEEVKVAMPQGAARLFTTPVVAHFHGRHPKVKLRIFERESAINRECAINGEVDFALVYNAQPHDELQIIPLLLERIFVIAPPEGVAQRCYPDFFEFDDLEKLPLILPSSPHSYRAVLHQASGRKDFAPNVIMEVNGISTSLEMVQKGLGYTVSTYQPVQGRIEAGNLTGVPLTSANCEIALSLVHRTDRAMSPTFRDLKAIIQEVACGIEPSPHWRPVAELEPAMPV